MGNSTFQKKRKAQASNVISNSRYTEEDDADADKMNEERLRVSSRYTEKDDDDDDEMYDGRPRGNSVEMLIDLYNSNPSEEEFIKAIQDSMSMTEWIEDFSAELVEIVRRMEKDRNMLNPQATIEMLLRRADAQANAPEVILRLSAKRGKDRSLPPLPIRNNRRRSSILSAISGRLNRFSQRLSLKTAQMFMPSEKLSSMHPEIKGSLDLEAGNLDDGLLHFDEMPPPPPLPAVLDDDSLFSYVHQYTFPPPPPSVRSSIRSFRLSVADYSEDRLENGSVISERAFGSATSNWELNRKFGSGHIYSKNAKRRTFGSARSNRQLAGDDENGFLQRLVFQRGMITDSQNARKSLSSREKKYLSIISTFTDLPPDPDSIELSDIDSIDN